MQGKNRVSTTRKSEKRGEQKATQTNKHTSKQRTLTNKRKQNLKVFVIVVVAGAIVCAVAVTVHATVVDIYTQQFLESNSFDLQGT